MSSGAASRRGIVHVVDALVAIAVLSAVVVGSVILVVDRLSTRVNTPPYAEGLNSYIAARLESGDWIPLLAEGKADSIRKELEDLFSGSPQPPSIAVYIYVMSPSRAHLQVYASSDPGLQTAYTALRYYVPLGGYYGDMAVVLEVRVYWP